MLTSHELEQLPVLGTSLLGPEKKHISTTGIGISHITLLYLVTFLCFYLCWGPSNKRTCNKQR